MAKPWIRSADKVFQPTTIAHCGVLETKQDTTIMFMHPWKKLYYAAVYNDATLREYKSEADYKARPNQPERCFDLLQCSFLNQLVEDPTQPRHQHRIDIQFADLAYTLCVNAPSLVEQENWCQAIIACSPKLCVMMGQSTKAGHDLLPAVQPSSRRSSISTPAAAAQSPIQPADVGAQPGAAPAPAPLVAPEAAALEPAPAQVAAVAAPAVAVAAPAPVPESLPAPAPAPAPMPAPAPAPASAPAYTAAASSSLNVEAIVQIVRAETSTFVSAGQAQVLVSQMKGSVGQQVADASAKSLQEAQTYARTVSEQAARAAVDAARAERKEEVAQAVQGLEQKMEERKEEAVQAVLGLEKKMEESTVASMSLAGQAVQAAQAGEARAAQAVTLAQSTLDRMVQVQGTLAGLQSELSLAAGRSSHGGGDEELSTIKGALLHVSTHTAALLDSLEQLEVSSGQVTGLMTRVESMAGVTTSVSSQLGSLTSSLAAQSVSLNKALAQISTELRTVLQAGEQAKDASTADTQSLLQSTTSILALLRHHIADMQSAISGVHEHGEGQDRALEEVRGAVRQVGYDVLTVLDAQHSESSSRGAALHARITSSVEDVVSLQLEQRLAAMEGRIEERVLGAADRVYHQVEKAAMLAIASSAGSSSAGSSSSSTGSNDAAGTPLAPLLLSRLDTLDMNTQVLLGENVKTTAAVQQAVLTPDMLDRVSAALVPRLAEAVSLALGSRMDRLEARLTALEAQTQGAVGTLATMAQSPIVAGLLHPAHGIAYAAMSHPAPASPWLDQQHPHPQSQPEQPSSPAPPLAAQADPDVLMARTMHASRMSGVEQGVEQEGEEEGSTGSGAQLEDEEEEEEGQGKAVTKAARQVNGQGTEGEEKKVEEGEEAGTVLALGTLPDTPSDSAGTSTATGRREGGHGAPASASTPVLSAADLAPRLRDLRLQAVQLQAELCRHTGGGHVMLSRLPPHIRGREDLAPLLHKLATVEEAIVLTRRAMQSAGAGGLGLGGVPLGSSRGIGSAATSYGGLGSPLGRTLY